MKALTHNQSVNGWDDDVVPYICWDRSWTVGEIKTRLRDAEDVERHRLMAWLMRELKPSEVWYFLTPSQVYEQFDYIQRWLGPAREGWAYLLRTWHEMGRI